jgi:hypothetical protein
MAIHRSLSPSWRILTRAAGLAAVLLSSLASAQSLAGGYYVTIHDQDGGVTRAPLSGFDIRLVGEDGSKATLLLPAVQSAREAARRVEEASCSGELLESVIIESRPGTRAETYMKWKLEQVHFTSSTVSVNPSGDAVPTETWTLNFVKVEWTHGSTGEVSYYDCSTGRCICDGEGAPAP